MTKREQAKILLDALNEYIQVDYNFEEFYVKALIKGLMTIEQRKKTNSDGHPS